MSVRFDQPWGARFLDAGGAVVNVRNPKYGDGGARGDGRTDDTAAFRDAALDAGRNGTVLVPWTAHAYRVTAQIPLTCSWRGVSGRGGDYLLSNVTAGSIIAADGAFHTFGNGEESIFGVVMEGLILRGGSDRHAHVHLRGVGEKGARLLTFEHCAFHGKAHALLAEGRVFVVDVVRCLANEQAGDAYRFDHRELPQNGISIEGGWIRASGGHGISSFGAAGTTLLRLGGGLNVTDSAHGTSAVHVRQASGVVIDGVNVEGWGRLRDGGYAPGSCAFDLSAQALDLSRFMVYGSDQPVRLRHCTSFRVASGRLLRHTGAGGVAVVVDHTCSNGIIETLRHDFAQAVRIHPDAANVTEVAEGAFTCSRERLYLGELHTEGGVRIGPGGARLARMLSETFPWSIPALQPGEAATRTFDFPEARTGDVAAAGVAPASPAGVVVAAAAGAGEIAVTVVNHTLRPVPAVASELRVDVWQH